PVSLKPIHVDAAAVNVAHADALAIAGGKRVGIQDRDSTVRRLLVAVIGDRPDLHREGRICARLPRVVAGLDEMKEVIVRPVAGLDDRAPLGVPGDAVRIARSLSEDLELARAGVIPPHRTGEVMPLAVLRDDVTLVEHS